MYIYWIIATLDSSLLKRKQVRKVGLKIDVSIHFTSYEHIFIRTNTACIDLNRLSHQKSLVIPKNITKKY